MDAEAFAQEMVKRVCEGAGTQRVLRGLKADLGDVVDEATMRGALVDCERRAKAQLLEDATW